MMHGLINIRSTKYSLTKAFSGAELRKFFRSNTKQFSQLLDHGAAILVSCDKFRLFFTVTLTQSITK